MKAALPLLIFTATAATLYAQPFADSVAGYSGTQGSNGWRYGYYDVSGDVVPGYDPTNDFRQCAVWSGTEWFATNSLETSVSAYNAHPSGATNNPGYPLREQWSIRRWVSTVTGTVRIHGHVAKQNIQCGDGVTVMVMVNGLELFARSLAAGDGVGFDYSFEVQLHANDLVDFALTSGCCGDAACDGTQFTATIDQANFADSVLGYSGTQGSNGWWYGYYDVSGDVVPGYDPTNDFRQCAVWSGTEWFATNSLETSVSAYNAHPSGATNNPGYPLREQWSIRRWVSTVTDTVRLHGHVAKQNTQCGDGVTVMVMINGRKVFARSLAAGDGIGFDYSLGVQLHTNDLVDFALTSGCCGDAACDGTQFTATIDHANFSLEVRTAVEVGVPTILDQQYQMQQSPDLQTWQSIGTPFTGTGDTMYFLFSIRQLGSPGYFRAQVLP